VNLRSTVAALPRPVQFTIGFYLAHLLCSTWISSSQGFLILALVSWFVALWKGHLSVPWSPLYLPMGLYLAGSTVAALAAPRPLATLGELSEWFVFLIIPMGLSLYSAVPRLAPVAFRVLIFVASFASLWALYQYFVMGWNDLEQRISGPAAHVMTLSGILLAIALTMLAKIVWIRRWILIVPLSVVLLALLLSYTRSVWIGGIIGVVWILSRWRPRLVAALVPLVLVGLLALPLALFGRVVSTFDPEQTSNLDRLRMVQAGAEIVRDHPLFGVGTGTIKEVYPLYRLPDAPRFRIPHLHNNIAQLWAERGVVPTVAYLLLLAIVCRELWRRRNRAPAEADGGVAATIALAVAGLFEYNFGDGEVLMVWLNLLALSLRPLASGIPVQTPAPDPAN
jgi:putative inorganic carbon (hco3(-)) transporter